MSLARIVVNSRGESVILDNSLPSPKPKQAPRRKNHFFTYNNYKLEEIDGIVETLKKFAYKGKIQSEVGHKNKTPHLQGMIWCYEEHRDTEFKLPKQISWRKLLDEDNVADYCGKDDTHDGIFRTSWGFPQPLKLITPDRPWQLEILEIIKGEPDDRKVYWYWSEKGEMGKSQFAKYCVAKLDCVFIDQGKKPDIMQAIMTANMDIKRCVIFDIPRDNGNNVSYKSIESIKNGMIFSPKYESGYKLFNSPHLIVFANEAPLEHKLSQDRWVITKID